MGPQLWPQNGVPLVPETMSDKSLRLKVSWFTLPAGFSPVAVSSHLSCYVVIVHCTRYIHTGTKTLPAIYSPPAPTLPHSSSINTPTSNRNFDMPPKPRPYPPAAIQQGHTSPTNHSLLISNQVTDYLKKKGFTKTEAVFRQETSYLGPDGRPAQRTDDPGPKKYLKSFALLRNWIENNLDIYKVSIPNILALLYLVVDSNLFSLSLESSSGRFLFTPTWSSSARAMPMTRSTC